MKQENKDLIIEVLCAEITAIKEDVADQADHKVTEFKMIQKVCEERNALEKKQNTNRNQW